MSYYPLPAYSIGNALNFEPVNNALAGVVQQNNANRNYGLQQQQLGLEKQRTDAAVQTSNIENEGRLAQLYGGVAQTALESKNPDVIGKTWDTFKGSHPQFVSNLVAHGIDPNDAQGGLTFIQNEARGYQNPLDVQLRKAQIAGVQSENAIRGKQFTTVGQNVYGQPVYGVVDLNKPNGGVSPVQPMASAETAGSAGPGQGPTGADYLKTLPKPMADQVKAIAEGRIPIPGGFALKTPYWQQMMTHVSQYDPTFDAVNYNARAATRKDFTSGKSAQNITSFNTAIGHLDELDKAIDPLGNGAFPTLNAAKNAAAGITGNTKQQVALSNFQTARNAVKEELTRAFKGSGGSLTEVEGWDKEIDSAASPEALHAVVKKAVDLLGSRLDSVGEMYSKGMGTTADPVKLLSPKAQAIWQRLNGEAPAESSVSAPAPGVTHVWDPATGLRPVGGQ